MVPSPMPITAIEAETIKKLVDSGTIVIAGGGGGIPVFVDQRGLLEGMDAVIDKDLGSAVLAKEIGAGILSILTSVDNVAINYGKPDQKILEQITLAELKRYYSEGHFPPGSMGPKILAATKFLDDGGEMVTITSFQNARRAVVGEAGTRIVPD